MPAPIIFVLCALLMAGNRGQGASPPPSLGTPAGISQQSPSPAPPPHSASNTETAAPAPKPKKRRRKHKHVTPPTDAPEKVVINNGSTTEPRVQLSPSLSTEQQSQKRQITEQLLSTTDENLKKISERQLSATQQDTVSQIHQYLEQSKAAAAAGDLERSHTLAFKAHLLSDELLKHH